MRRESVRKEVGTEKEIRRKTQGKIRYKAREKENEGKRYKEGKVARKERM